MFEKLKKLIEYGTSKEVAPISRRYFTMNGFDGAMTLLGLIIGALIAGMDQENMKVVIFSALGSIMAIGLSGLTGAFMAERAERTRELKELERKMQRTMNGTDIGLESHFAAIWVAIVDSLSPVITSLISLSPLLLGLAFPMAIPPRIAGYSSVAVTLVILFLLGAYLGKISKRSILINGLQMVAAAVLMTILLILTGG